MGALIGAVFAGGLAALFLGNGREVLLELALGLGFFFWRVLKGEGIDDGAGTVALDEPCSRTAKDVADCRDGELPCGGQMRARSWGTMGGGRNSPLG
jgi:hypothetical protein